MTAQEFLSTYYIGKNVLVYCDGAESHKIEYIVGPSRDKQNCIFCSVKGSLQDIPFNKIVVYQKGKKIF